MKTPLLISVVLVILLVFFFGWKWIKVLTASDYEKMLDALYSHSVPLIKPNSIQNLSHYLVLDTRAANEYAVSALKDAQFVGYSEPNLECLKDVPKDKAILVYCSVGYRSERVGETLQKMGYTNVFNLYGGIFEWVNAQLPLVDSNQQNISKVHGYAPSWGKWIQAEIEIVYN